MMQPQTLASIEWGYLKLTNGWLKQKKTQGPHWLLTQALQALTVKEKPDFLFLMETKNPEIALQRLQRRLHFSHSFVCNPQGLA